jgi:hypothetical protein
MRRNGAKNIRAGEAALLERAITGPVHGYCAVEGCQLSSPSDLSSHPRYTDTDYIVSLHTRTGKRSPYIFLSILFAGVLVEQHGRAYGAGLSGDIPYLALDEPPLLAAPGELAVEPLKTPALLFQLL